MGYGPEYPHRGGGGRPPPPPARVEALPQGLAAPPAGGASVRGGARL